MVDNSESMIQLMLLSVVEAAINKALSLDAISLASLQEYKGKMIRIKTVAPYMSLYFLICEDGVQIFHQHYGPVDARVRAPATSLAWHIFGLSKSDPALSDHYITVAGDRDLVDGLAEIAQDFNIWLSVQHILKEWLPQYNTIDEIWQSLNSRDPIWVERLQYLPQVLNDAVIQLRRHSERQEKKLDEMNATLRSLQSQQRFNTKMGVAVAGLVVVVVVALSAINYTHLPWLKEIPIQAALYGALGR